METNAKPEQSMGSGFEAYAELGRQVEAAAAPHHAEAEQHRRVAADAPDPETAQHHQDMAKLADWVGNEAGERTYLDGQAAKE